MKRKTIISRLRSLVERNDDLNNKQKAAIADLIEKLKKKERKLHAELKATKSSSRRHKLKTKIRACKAQRKKGEALLSEFEILPSLHLTEPS